jgi:hypothetical protein
VANALGDNGFGHLPSAQQPLGDGRQLRYGETMMRASIWIGAKGVFALAYAVPASAQSMMQHVDLASPEMASAEMTRATITEVELDGPKAGEVLVEVKATGMGLPARKNFTYRSKSITQRNLTEIQGVGEACSLTPLQWKRPASTAYPQREYGPAGSLCPAARRAFPARRDIHLRQSVSCFSSIEKTAPSLTSTFLTMQTRPILSANFTS